MLPYCRDPAEQIAAGDQKPDPQRRTHHTEGEEATVDHASDPGDERREGAHDRNESRKDDRLSAMAGVEGLRPLQGSPVQESRMPAICDPASEQSADPVVA